MVYTMLQDPEVLSKIIPGCEELKLVSENNYTAELQISVGPVKSHFKGHVSVSDMVPPESYQMNIDGQGQAGFVKGIGHVKLEEQGDTTTLMTYEGDAQVGGRIVSVGSRLLDSTAKALTRQSLENANQHIKARLLVQQAPVASPADAQASPEAAQPAAAPVSVPVELKAPSQIEFASGVAKDVIADLVPPDRRPILIGGGVVLLLLLFIVLRRRS